MKQIRLIIATASVALLLAACSKTNPEQPAFEDKSGVQITVTSIAEASEGALEGTLVLNNGNFGSNDASVSLRKADGTVVENVFLSKNGRKLGDTAQDMLEYNGLVYIAVYGSKTIFVTDKNLKIVAQIDAAMKSNGAKLSPRSFKVAQGKVYVSYYEGFLGEFNPADKSTRCVAVGPNPEGIEYCNGRLFVANSGGMAYDSGYNNTVSVVNPTSMIQEGTITVNCNPQNIVASPNGKSLYILSWGNYYDIPAKLQHYDIATGQISDTEYTDTKTICKGPGSTLFVVTGAYDAAYQVEAGIYKHEMNTNKAQGKLGSGTYSPYYSMNCCSEDNLLFVGLSNYMSEGQEIMVDMDGKELARWNCKGLNPMKAVILK